jgi:small conductance mechanosensitive channel
MEKFQDLDIYIEKYGQKLIDFIPSLVSALLILFIGIWIVRFLNKLVKKFFDKTDYDEALEKFLANIINWGLKIVLFVLVITQLGVESASLVAIIGAGGLAIGLALQGSLSNFAGGVLILLLKPFKIGDFISAQGIDGTVKEISIFNTKLNTTGNQLAILPNGKLSNENIINFTSEGLRRESLTFGIGYDDDIRKAKDILLTLVKEQKQVFAIEDKLPMVAVSELGDSSVNLLVRYWCNTEDFWQLRWLILEEGKARLEAAGISIPFPQRDVHHFNLEKLNKNHTTNN